VDAVGGGRSDGRVVEAEHRFAVWQVVVTGQGDPDAISGGEPTGCRDQRDPLVDGLAGGDRDGAALREHRTSW
jgi:hypothetical protein